MSERIEDDNELLGDQQHKALWQQLEGLSQAEPGQHLRQRVMQDINARSAASSRPWWQWFIPAGPQPVIGMAMAALFGIAIGLGASRGGSDLDQRMANLETQLVSVNQQLLMSRLTAASPSERLAAALEASSLSERDPVIAAALLQRAATDVVPSVRSAAIAALGSEINSQATFMQLLRLLEDGESPIVQMAIVDLVLRHGDKQLIRTLHEHVQSKDIHPALAGYVSDTIGELEI